MLRRHSTKTRPPRLIHSKSTSSVRNSLKNFEHIDPAAAERDAHIAANLSFARARDRSSTDMVSAPREIIVSERDSRTSRTSEHEMSRQQSVRFVGSCSIPRRSMGSRIVETQSLPQASGARLNVLGNAENRPTSRSSPNGKAPERVSTADNYLIALEASEDYYTPEDDIASAPSSYRRLRKSRSMFTSSDQSTGTYFFTSASPDRPTSHTVPPRFSSLSNKENQPLPSRYHGLRGPRSMSFLRSRREPRGSRSSSRQDNDVAVQVARDKFREQVQQQEGLKSHPSMFFRSKNKRTGGSLRLRKSLRSSSNQSNPITALPTPSTATINVPKDGLRKKARKVSRSLKSKIKSLFHRSKSSEEALGMPVPHADAPKPRTMGVYDDDDDDDEEPETFMESTNTHPLDECSMSQVQSRVPSLHAVASNQQLRSRQGSMESIKSDQKVSDEKSRVTSWTSSGRDTVGSQNTWEWERQRLSVIKENGAHVSSSSFRPTLGSQMPYRPCGSSTSLHCQPLPPVPTVDSQRVYSALMKRLDETRQREQHVEQFRQRSVEDFRRDGTLPARSSSVERAQEDIERDSPCTIRCVKPEDDVFCDEQGYDITRSRQTSRTVSSENHGTDSPTGSVIRGRQKSRSIATSPYTIYAVPAPRDSEDLSLAKTQEKLDPAGKTLATRTSAFFASPAYHMFRTTSPYRRALQERIKEAQDPSRMQSPEPNPLLSPSLPSLPPRRPGSQDSDEDSRLAYSESIYSRASNEPDASGGKDADGVANNFPIPPGTLRQAIISEEPLVNLPTLPADRAVSTASSLEWKTWLSANVGKLESPVSEDSDQQPAAIPYAIPAMTRSFGHIREATEISDDADVMRPLRICKPTGSVGGISIPNTPLRSMEPNVTLSPMTARTWQSTRSSARAIPFDNQQENEAPRIDSLTHCHGRFDSPRMPPPPIPVKSELRSPPSLPVLYSTPNGNLDAEFGRKGGGVTSLPRKHSLAATEKEAVSEGFLTRTPARLVKWRNNHAGHLSGSASSPGLTAAVEKQLGSMGLCQKDAVTSPRAVEADVFPSTPAFDAYNAGSPYVADGSGVFGPDERNPQTIGSRRMVDLFLSSRRRRAAGSDDTSAFM
jgi:hypothetical protein